MYRKLQTFAPNVENQEVNNPVSMCIGDTIARNFNHGSSNSYIYGCHSQPCQEYMSSYCAVGWDGFCEYNSNNNNISFPNQVIPWNTGSLGLNSGQILVRNTAGKKYLKHMGGPCYLKTQPFDATNVSSPMYSGWAVDTYMDSSGESTVCKPVYTVKSAVGIDQDPVMNKLLEQPFLGMDILTGIYYTLKQENRLGQFNGTKLGTFFNILKQKGAVN